MQFGYQLDPAWRYAKHEPPALCVDHYDTLTRTHRYRLDNFEWPAVASKSPAPP